MEHKRKKEYTKNRRLVIVLSAAIVLILFIWLTIAVGRPLVQLASDPSQFQAWIDAKGWSGRFIFLGIQMLQVVIAMIPGEVIEIGAGYAFGALEGTLLCLVGIVLGSGFIFALTRILGVRLVEAFISREKIYEMRWIRDEKRLNMILFLVFFIPGTPKDLLTYFVGLTPVRLRTFLLISTIARLPSVVSSTVGGHALGTQQYILAIIVFLVTGVFSLCGMILYQKWMKHKSKA